MKKIALIEDNYYFLDNLRRLLVMKDFKTEVFKSIKEAEEGLEKFNPDLIITDLTLPDGNGADTIEQLRQNRFFDYTPIIILTGTPDINPNILLTLGVYKVLTKPISFENLYENILRALNKRDKYLAENRIINKAKKLFLPNFFN